MARTHTHTDAQGNEHACSHDHGAPGTEIDSSALLTAVHTFLRAPSPELQEAMVAALRSAAYLAVVTYDPPLPAGHDGRATIPAGTTMHFRGRVAPDGKQLLAIYSDLEAVRKDLPGQSAQTTVLTADRMVTFALHPPHAGAVLNPAGPYLELRAPELRSIVPETAAAQ